jgi:hypothetical protein
MPFDIHTGAADPTIPTLDRHELMPTFSTRDRRSDSVLEGREHGLSPLLRYGHYKARHHSGDRASVSWVATGGDGRYRCRGLLPGERCGGSGAPRTPSTHSSTLSSDTGSPGRSSPQPAERRPTRGRPEGQESTSTRRPTSGAAERTAQEEGQVIRAVPDPDTDLPTTGNSRRRFSAGSGW